MQKVIDIMTPDVVSVSPEESILRAAQMMEELNVGAIPVCDGDKLIGMITDRDITVRVTSTGTPAETAKVKDAMTVNVSSCFGNQPVDELMDQMRDAQIRRVPVIDHNTHKLIGIVSLGDLATKHSAEVDRTLYEISTPSEPDR